MSGHVRVSMIKCDGHGVCAELVPELIGLDEWGYPTIAPGPVPDPLNAHVDRAVALCPKLALRVERQR